MGEDERAGSCPPLLSYIYLWSAMNKWMLALLSRLVFQKADIVLFVHGHSEYNGCSGEYLVKSISSFLGVCLRSTMFWAEFSKDRRHVIILEKFHSVKNLPVNVYLKISAFIKEFNCPRKNMKPRDNWHSTLISLLIKNIFVYTWQL